VDGTGLGLAIVLEIAQQHGAEASSTSRRRAARARPPGRQPGALSRCAFRCDEPARVVARRQPTLAGCSSLLTPGA
jgi:signal transduction histidine kinase